MMEGKAQQYAALLSMVEIGLGSALHACHIPLSGQFLSLHQIFLLTLATKEDPDRWGSVKLSVYAGLMKIGLGHGKKIAPMLAISMQGLLFNLGLIFGRSTYVAAALSSLWALIQPFLLFQFLSWGNAAEILAFYVTKAVAFGIPVIGILAFSVGLKVGLALTACFLATKCGARSEQLYEKIRQKFPASQRPPKHLYQEMVRPFFLVSFLALTFYYWYTEPTHWYVLSARTAGLALLGTTISRALFSTVKWIPKRFQVKLGVFHNTLT